jgi:hypothetical protein
MQLEFELPCRRDRPAASFVKPPDAPVSRAPRIARLLALAHNLDAAVRSGEIPGYREAARLGRISAARLSQILLLVHLAPDIQEYILFASPHQARALSEYDLRRVARESDWRRQRAMFAKFGAKELTPGRNRVISREAATAAGKEIQNAEITQNHKVARNEDRQVRSTGKSLQQVFEDRCPSETGTGSDAEGTGKGNRLADAFDTRIPERRG